MTPKSCLKSTIGSSKEIEKNRRCGPFLFHLGVFCPLDHHDNTPSVVNILSPAFSCHHLQKPPLSLGLEEGRQCRVPDSRSLGTYPGHPQTINDSDEEEEEGFLFLRCCYPWQASMPGPWQIFSGCILQSHLVFLGARQVSERSQPGRGTYDTPGIFSVP